MPETAGKMWSQLGIDRDVLQGNLAEDGVWGALGSGKTVIKPVPLFPRIDTSKKG